MTILFKNQAFAEEWEQSLSKYRLLVTTLRDKGYNMQALIARALGTWYASTKSILWDCRVLQHDLKMMRHFMVSDTIQWLRHIYNEHIIRYHHYEDSLLRSPVINETKETDWITTPHSAHHKLTKVVNAFEHTPSSNCMPQTKTIVWECLTSLQLCTSTVRVYRVLLLFLQ